MADAPSNRTRNGSLVTILLLILTWLIVGLIWKPKLLTANAHNYDVATANEMAASWIPGANASPEMRQNNEFKARYENLNNSNTVTAAWYCYSLWSFEPESSRPQSAPSGRSPSQTTSITPLTSSSYESNWTQGSGLRISKVVSGSGAEQAGLQVGDILTCYNGSALNNVSDLNDASNGSGKIVLDTKDRTVILIRDGAFYTARVPYGPLDIAVGPR